MMKPIIPVSTPKRSIKIGHLEFDDNQPYTWRITRGKNPELIGSVLDNLVPFISIGGSVMPAQGLDYNLIHIARQQFKIKASTITGFPITLFSYRQVMKPAKLIEIKRLNNYHPLKIRLDGVKIK